MNKNIKARKKLLKIQLIFIFIQLHYIYEKTLFIHYQSGNYINIIH